MSYESIQKLIEENRDRVNFGTSEQGCSDYWIRKAESRLGLRFPPSYVWWLKNYKGGEIDGDEIFSVYEMDFDTIVGGDVVYINELERKNGIFTPNNLVIQHNDFGGDYYFDLMQVDKEGESPIYVFPERTKYADNFLDFLRKRIEL
jgi:hypothetical protein